MMVGYYTAQGDAYVLPLDEISKVAGETEYSIKKALDGKAIIPGKVFVKMPANASARRPAGK